MLVSIGQQKYWMVLPQSTVHSKNQNTNLDSSAAPPTFKVKPIEVDTKLLESAAKANFKGKKLTSELKRIAGYVDEFNNAAAAAKKENAKIYPTTKKTIKS